MKLKYLRLKGSVGNSWYKLLDLLPKIFARLKEKIKKIGLKNWTKALVMEIKTETKLKDEIKKWEFKNFLDISEKKCKSSARKKRKSEVDKWKLETILLKKLNELEEMGDEFGVIKEIIRRIQIKITRKRYLSEKEIDTYKRKKKTPSDIKGMVWILKLMNKMYEKNDW
jgi:hypothetical protein